MCRKQENCSSTEQGEIKQRILLKRGCYLTLSLSGLPRVLEVLEDRWHRFGKTEPHWKPSSMLVDFVENHGNPHITQWMKLYHKSTQSHL